MKLPVLVSVLSALLPASSVQFGIVDYFEKKNRVK